MERKMRKGAASALLFAVAVLGAPAMAAEQCTVADGAVEKAGGYGNAIAAMVKAAPDCQRAYKILSVCALGSSGDNALSESVRSKCEPLFMAKASPAAKNAYRTALARCDRIAEKNEGTMYQGFAAVCRAGAARDFAGRFTRRR
jgi:hypothetical protein